MIEQTDLNELAPALIAAQGEFEAVSRDAANPFFKSRYASLQAVVKAASPILTKHGLAVTQVMGDDTLTTVLMHSSGQCISGMATLHMSKDDAQGVGSAVTYFRRYGYMAILGLVADLDDDGNEASTQLVDPTPQRRPSPVVVAQVANAAELSNDF